MPSNSWLRDIQFLSCKSKREVLCGCIKNLKTEILHKNTSVKSRTTVEDVRKCGVPSVGHRFSHSLKAHLYRAIKPKRILVQLLHAINQARVINKHIQQAAHKRYECVLFHMACKSINYLRYRFNLFMQASITAKGSSKRSTNLPLL